MVLLPIYCILSTVRMAASFQHMFSSEHLCINLVHLRKRYATCNTSTVPPSPPRPLVQIPIYCLHTSLKILPYFTLHKTSLACILLLSIFFRHFVRHIWGGHVLTFIFQTPGIARLARLILINYGPAHTSAHMYFSTFLQTLCTAPSTHV
jgi:hypothetical protein